MDALKLGAARWMVNELVDDYGGRMIGGVREVTLGDGGFVGAF